jgi:hypothetical protein
MRKALILFSLICLFPTRVAFAQEGEELLIASPVSGQVVQGLVVVTGTISVLGFSSYELSFSYSQDETDTWFPIQTSTTPVFEGNLGTWDTTVLTDGDYNLRLRVFLLDGNIQEISVNDVLVRNYTPVPTKVPTETPTEIAPLSIPTARYIATEPATATASFPTPTPLPANPVALDRGTIIAAIGRGALASILAILLLAFLLRMRRD